MAVQSWTGLSILFGGLQVACNAKSFNAPVPSVVELDKSALCDTWDVYIAGRRSVTWNATLMQDFAADGLDQRVFAALAVPNVPVSLLPAGTTSGSVGWAFPSLPLSYTPIEATHGDLATASLSGRGSGVTVRGTLMHPPATSRTSSSTGTAYQLGAITAAQRMFCSAHVTLTSGTSEQLVLKLQSSATEGGSYSDRITFTTATDVTSEWSSVAGAVTDTWWRASWTISGSDTPTFQFAMVAGIGPLA